MSYQKEYRESIEHPEAFWSRQAELISWFEKPKTILSQDEKGFYHWFKGGKLNTSYLTLDFHVENGRADQTALIYDSPVTETVLRYSFQELKEEVSKFAGVLREKGIEKGDRVIIYMPMIPEAVVAMLACARLGAIHSVVFGGFAPNELAIRIDDAKPKVLVTASCGIEFSNIIEYKPLVDEALRISNDPPVNVILLQRPQANASMQAGRDFDWDELMSSANPADPVPVDATDPLYILYTSGTTGLPKGVVRENGGHAVALKYSMKSIFNSNPGEVYWAGSDVGWVVGHSYIVYAPLIHGCATILYEGKPVRTPDAGAFWRVISDHQVNTFFTAPTAFRAVKKEDPEAKLKDQYDISSLRTLFLAGERLDPPTYDWLEGIMNCPVVDHWWQTESGWPMCSNPMGLEAHPVKVGSATFPVPGYDIQVLDDEGQPCEPGTTGNIVVKLPLPPSCFPTLWNDDERFQKSYLSQFPGYYQTGDGGIIDEDGYVFIMGRVDDVINVAGHRLSTGQMEELIGSHNGVAECAVVGIDDELRGQVPVGFAVLKDGVQIGQDDLEKELVAIIRNEIGAVACFRKSAIVKRLPKTRSGKILRKTIRQLAFEEDVPVPATIDDPVILSEIKDAMEACGIGKYSES
ncbi:MAG: propionyl-CoA synthetase [SAR324 cluster bacterium]|nr:propionyl-CoA synthetase [Deltaproteobacteria bacterium]MBI12017.1 propionyl-CoA synthetase [Deltaproteobacteria bacterium]MDP7501959.1 propionyl-CoA synthetase [SAR324 cluster bacterium]